MTSSSILIIYIYPTQSSYMRQDQGFQIHRLEMCKTRHFIYFLVFYLGLIVATRFYQTTGNNQSRLLAKISNQSLDVQVKSFMRELPESEMIGTFDIVTYNNKSSYLPQKGQLYVQIQKHLQEIHNRYILFNFKLKLGEYFEDGIIDIQFSKYKYDDLQVKHESNDTLICTVDQQSFGIGAKIQVFDQYLIKQQQNVNITNFNVRFHYLEGQIYKVIFFETEGFGATIFIQGLYENLIGDAIFAMIMLLIASRQFIILFKLHSQMTEGNANLGQYSYGSFFIATLWDAIFFMFCFMQLFTSSTNIVVFLFPTFIFFALYSNLETKLAIEIYKHTQPHENTFPIFFKFMILFYLSFPAIILFLLLTNSENALIFLLSLIYLPQLYHNASKNKRPDCKSTYNREFLPLRLLFVVIVGSIQFYVKALPFNSFERQPNFWFCLIIMGTLFIQYCLLVIQQIHGPRKIFPKFCLPPVYSYHVELSTDLENSIDQNLKEQVCAICLLSLIQQINQNENQLVEHMKTPCGHMFHKSCLTSWMQIKMQCPSCRSKLPVYE